MLDLYDFNMFSIVLKVFAIFATVTLSTFEFVAGQTMSIQPRTISVGASVDPTASPEVVVMECRADGLTSVEQIYSMYIKRESTSFAEITVGNSAVMSTYAPSDIKVKTPTLDGRIDSNNVYSSFIKATFLVSKMDCKDEGTYQCHIFYKPAGMDSDDRFADMDLTVNVLPRDLQITAAMAQSFGSVPIQNQSIVDVGEQVEFTCTGYTGSSESAVIEWFKKTPPNTFFQRHFPSQADDTIDDGFPSSTQCEYMRTSKLRFTMTSAETGRLAFRCEVPSTLTSGQQVRVYSEEFHLTSGLNPINGADKPSSGIILIFWIAVYLVIASVCRL